MSVGMLANVGMMSDVYSLVVRLTVLGIVLVVCVVPKLSILG